LAEWLYERGIGEDRAILVENCAILEARIALPGATRAGTIAPGRLTTILVPGRRGIVALDQGGECLIEPLPARLTEGEAIRVEIVREGMPEAGRTKLAKCRLSDHPVKEGPMLRESLIGKVIEIGPNDPDRFEQAGWSELLEEANTGEVAFAGGALRMSLTPAMTLFDVDGALDPAELAVAGAAGAGRSIRRFDIGGSIGIDLPTLAERAARQAAAAALDDVLPPPFERTAVNGFGFLQIVRRRARPSLPEMLLSDPAGAAARALLRRAERRVGGGSLTLAAAPAVIARIERNPPWLDALARTIGAPVCLQAQPGLAISAGHVHSQIAC